jgi:hypothetical protein
MWVKDAEESFYIVHVDCSVYHANEIFGGLKEVPVLGWRGGKRCSSSLRITVHSRKSSVRVVQASVVACSVV